MAEWRTCRDVADWFPERLERAKVALIAAGVPEQFWHCPEQPLWVREHDTAWLRFEAGMWKRSYEVALYAAAQRDMEAVR
jgi:hypothetical protein